MGNVVFKVKIQENKQKRRKRMISQTKTKENQEINQIEVLKIAPNPNQPRKVFNEENIIKLADSISQYGIIQPLTIRKIGDGYELVAGERRLRAAKELGFSHVPCVVIDINESKSAEISIIENLLREDLNMFEQAEAIQALIDTYELTQEQIAAKLSNSQSFVANKLRLLRYNSQEREMFLRNGLTERHARALLRVLDADLRAKILDKVTNEHLNVSATESLVDGCLGIQNNENKVETRTYKSINSFYSAINRAIDTIKNSGIEIKSRRVEGDEFTELTILVPKQNNHNLG